MSSVLSPQSSWPSCISASLGDFYDPEDSVNIVRPQASTKERQISMIMSSALTDTSTKTNSANEQHFKMVSFFALPLELRQMIYEYTLGLQPHEIQYETWRIKRSTLRSPHLDTRRVSTSQLSKLVRVVGAVEVAPMLTLYKFHQNVLCFDKSPRLHLESIIHWSVVFDSRCGKLNFDAFANSWDVDVARCLEPFWQAVKSTSSGDKEHTVHLLLPDRTEKDLSAEWSIATHPLLGSEKVMRLYRHLSGDAYDEYVRKPRSFMCRWYDGEAVD